MRRPPTAKHESYRTLVAYFKDFPLTGRDLFLRGPFSLGSACHQIFSMLLSFHDEMRARIRTDVVPNVRTGSARSRANGEDACPRHHYSTFSLLLYCVWRWSGLAPVNADLGRDKACTNVEGIIRGTEKASGAGERLRRTPGEYGGAATDLENYVCR